MDSPAPLISVYTQVYNSKNFLKQSIDSVLNQTYQNIEYLIVDNGCTDGSSEILKEYQKRDSRIRLLHHETNQRGFWDEYIYKYTTGDYVMTLDSDDWLELDAIENSLNFALKHNLDISIFGTFFHLPDQKNANIRCTKDNLIINRNSFAQFYPQYHAFCRTHWAKLFKRAIIEQEMSTDYSKRFKNSKYTYGGDTVYCFSCIRQANLIGLLSKPMYHYRVHSGSVSYKYDPMRFKSDVALFLDGLDFLQGYGPVSLQNLTFLYIVYCNAVNDTLNVIEKSQLSPKEKLEEYKKIALEPITQGAYQVSDESATNSKGFLFLYMLKNASLVENSQDYLESLSFYLPHCSKVLAMADADLLGQNDAFFQPLLKDDASLLRDNLLQEFKKSPYRSQEKIVNLLSALTDELPVCKTATTHRFINHFFKIYGYLLHSQHLEALEEMTDLLLNHRVKDAQEVFFQVYLTLAALLQQEPAYLFGKIQMAEYLFSAKHYQEAAQIVAELEKMGLSEHDDVVKLKKKLARYLPA